MGETAAVSNLAEEWTFEGKTFKVTRRKFAVEAEFERFCAKKQLEHIRSMKEHYSPLEYAEAQEGHRRDGGAFQFSWGSPISIVTLSSVQGQREMVFQRLANANPIPGIVTRDLVQRIYDSRTILRTEPLADGTEKPVYPWDELVDLMGRLDDPNRNPPPPAAVP